MPYLNRGPKRDHNFDNHPTDNFGLQRLGVKLWGSVHDPRSPETETHKIENFSVREPYIIRISGLDSSGCKLLDLDVLLTYSSTASTVPKMRRRGFCSRTKSNEPRSRVRSTACLQSCSAQGLKALFQDKTGKLILSRRIPTLSTVNSSGCELFRSPLRPNKYSKNHNKPQKTLNKYSFQNAMAQKLHRRHKTEPPLPQGSRSEPSNLGRVSGLGV